MTTVLLTLGRLPKALDLARGFSRAGSRVIVADPFGWTLTGASRHVAREFAVPPPSKGSAEYLAALAEIVAREHVDIVVPVSEETMHVAFLPDLLGGRARVFTMPPDRVLSLHNKAGFVRAATAMGLPVPDTCLLGAPEAEALASAHAVVVKPVFIAGREHSSCTIAHEGRVVSTMIYRGTVMSGSVAIAFERVEAPAIERWIEIFVRASGWTGFISFDFIVDADDCVFGIECNPRTTSGLHFWRPEDVARAVLSPQTSPPVGVRRHSYLQQFYSCLTETQMAMFRGRGFLHRLGRLVGTRDVTWDWRDPWPFLSMTLTSWPIIRMAVSQGVSFGEAATHDVGWYEQAANAPDAQPS